MDDVCQNIDTGRCVVCQIVMWRRCMVRRGKSYVCQNASIHSIGETE